jgi:hypothetical protein
VQVQIEIANRQDGTDQHDADNGYQNIGVARSGDKTRQMTRGAWMK